MAKTKFSSPRLKLTIDETKWQTAKQSDSGGCLIADAIRDAYPVDLRKDDVDVTVATIEIRDRVEGVKYTYLTPPDAQQLLLAFDQGWPQPSQTLTVTRAVKITPIRKGGAIQLEKRRLDRLGRLAELEEKEDAGILTSREKSALTRMRNAKPTPDRPTSNGPAEVEEVNGVPVVYGGRPLKKNPGNLNLLGGRRRIFGAKVADPGQAFREAVEKAVEERERAAAQPVLVLD
jgi:hypothetical protein